MDRPSQPASDREPPLTLVALDSPAAADGTGRATVVEQLRLRVPAAWREAWLEAEQQTWAPWLRQQKSFLGRQVLWDRDRQEGVLLIHWGSRDDWKAIPDGDVAAIQGCFEATAKRLLALPLHSENPFPLLGAAEAPLP